MGSIPIQITFFHIKLNNMKEKDLPKIEKGEPEYGFTLIVNIPGPYHIMLFLHELWKFFETQGLENRSTVVKALNITPHILPTYLIDDDLLKNYQNNKVTWKL